MIRAIFLLSALFLVTIFSLEESVIVVSNTQLPQVQVSWPLDVGKMRDTQLYDMLARYYGAPRVSTHDQLRINVDMFDRPQGHLLFSIDGLSSRQMVRSDYKAFGEKLVDLETGTDGKPYSVMGSVLTGTVGSVRESSWDVYTVGNFYDAMHTVYGGKVMVSGAAEKQAAMVLSPHRKNFGATKSHYWEPKIKSFVSVVELSSYTIGINDFPGLMKDLAVALDAQVDYNAQDHIVTITGTKGGEEVVSYDLTSVEEETLFAELLFVVNMAHHPVDFFSFHFNSLVSIISKYGASSAEYDMAVQMIDAVIARVKSAYETRSNYETTIIYFPESYRSKEVLSTVETSLEKVMEGKNENIRTEIQSNSLHITVAVESSKFDEICSTLKTDLTDLTVNCAYLTSKRSLLQNGTEPTPEPSPAPPPGPPAGTASQQEIELVHIVLWLVIAMIASLVQACYHLSVLDGSNEPEFKAKNYEGAGIRSKTHKM
jgi:hypothetical protein